ncbi:Protein N-acetyltransferase, RimJ/RimL family [Clostridium amylolyticum]|uniref:Protein N-acetyltransferase, RimJ/RimL family n=1 Tax=Clostridium amylolyticum TaxID=1121298 RepID=A0A1M6LMY2_9CLOT|nr:GNAT family protein [Clostridium amylolyticum]SHJ72490.1 Protein N-acetyltransferase, RimJ/RimL family [Clostridium amylolyticum]
MYYGNKIKLREYKREDIALAYSYVNDMEVKRLLVTDVPFPTIYEQEESWFESLLKEKNNYNFAIEDLETGSYIGGCGINNLDWLNRVATIGIMIGDKRYWGKGYGTDAIKVLNKFIFQQMNINKIKLNVFSFNERARKCYEKCGFQVEGILRQELFRDGEYHDEYVMGLLLEDWKSKVNSKEI